MDIGQKPKIFVGSTVEGKKYVEALEVLFQLENCEIVPWFRYFDQSPLQSTFSQLIETKKFDFAIIIFTPDDKSVIREESYITPRDNLIFELGLFIAYLGIDRVFPVVPVQPQLKLPTDLLGTNPYVFEFSRTERPMIKLQNAMSTACYKIKDKINFLGPSNKIKLHSKVVYDPKKNRLRFKVGYTGPGSLLNMKLSAHLIKVNKAGKGYTRNWKKMDLRLENIPELSVSWTFSHSINKKSPFSNLLKAKEEITIQDLNELEKILIRVDVNGYESINMRAQFANMVYDPSEIVRGKFKGFYTINANGKIDKKSIDWDLFNKIIEKDQ